MCEPGGSAALEEIGELAAGAVRIAWKPFTVLLGAAFVLAHLWLLLGLAAAVTAGTVVVLRVLSRHMLVVAPRALRQRTALAAPVRVRAVVLPRNLSIGRKRPQALPAPERVIEGAVVPRGQQVR